LPLPELPYSSCNSSTKRVSEPLEVIPPDFTWKTYR
jgi:hypothetical protein